MGDILTRDSLDENFPSNSHKRKAKESAPVEKVAERKKLEKVITGKAVKQKKGMGRKMAETFLEDDADNIKDYVVHDVLIPAAKSMICDVVGWGGFAEMLLFGNKRGGMRAGRIGNRNHTNYNNVSYKSTERDRDRRRDISSRSRSRHDFDDVIIETRGEAEEVLSCLVDLTIDYGMASVADFYELVDIKPEFTDDKWGWTELNRDNSGISRVRGGYLIKLPRTQPLD